MDTDITPSSTETELEDFARGFGHSEDQITKELSAVATSALRVIERAKVRTFNLVLLYWLVLI